MTDPWVFGWTQLLTLSGFVITISIAYLGFRSFERWRREKIEERKIEIALEALALAHESKYIFDSIRSPMSYPYEWENLPKRPEESEDQWRARGSYYAILTRIERNKDFFERLFKLQPKFMAMFGADKEGIFLHCHQARRFVEVSARMLMRQVGEPAEWNENRERQHNQWEADIWEGLDEVYPGTDRVSMRLKAFKEGIAAVCTPITQHREVPTLFSLILVGCRQTYAWAKKRTEGHWSRMR